MAEPWDEPRQWGFQGEYLCYLKTKSASKTYFKDKKTGSNRPAETHTQFDFDFTLNLKKALSLPRLTSVFSAFSV